MKKNGVVGKLTKGGLGGAATVAAYQWIVKPWHLRWGATDAEAQGQFPGDDVVKNPTQLSTRAVTIDALPEEIWPWLVQMGQGRGDAYSYDWIENLMGLDIHSANNIIPELQTLKVGDTIPLESGGTGLLVESMEPNKYLLLKYPDGGWTWFFGLYPLDKTRTRLVVRNRWTTVHFKFAKRAWFALTEPGTFVMERKMMLGIKKRSEAFARRPV